MLAIKKYLLIMLTLISGVNAMDQNDIQDKKRNLSASVKYKYLHAETESGIIFARDHSGIIEMNILSKPNKPIKIDKITFDSPRKLFGYSIDIGDFHIDKDQQEDRFLRTIDEISPLLYVLSHEDSSAFRKTKGASVLEVETINRTIFTKRPNFVSIQFNPKDADPITIGGKILLSPKRVDFSASKIQIGSFVLDKKQTENEFLSTITTFDSIRYKVKQSSL